MIELAEEHARDQAGQELRFLQAIRVAVPACFDDKSRGAFEKREARLLEICRGKN